MNLLQTEDVKEAGRPQYRATDQTNQKRNRFSSSLMRLNRRTISEGKKRGGRNGKEGCEGGGGGWYKGERK